MSNITVKLTLVEIGELLNSSLTITANVGIPSITSATKTQLLQGLNIEVDDTATTVTVTSTGSCTSSYTMQIQGRPIPTTTTTTTEGEITTTTTTEEVVTTTTTTEEVTTTTTTEDITTTTTTAEPSYDYTVEAYDCECGYSNTFVLRNSEPLEVDKWYLYSNQWVTYKFKVISFFGRESIAQYFINGASGQLNCVDITCPTTTTTTTNP